MFQEPVSWCINSKRAHQRSQELFVHSLSGIPVRPKRIPRSKRSRCSAHASLLLLLLPAWLLHTTRLALRCQKKRGEILRKPTKKETKEANIDHEIEYLII